MGIWPGLWKVVGFGKQKCIRRLLHRRRGTIIKKEEGGLWKGLGAARLGRGFGRESEPTEIDE